MNWNLLFGAVTAVSAAAGSTAIIIAVLQLRFSSWLKAQEVFTEPEFTKARGVVLPRYWRGDQHWTKEDMESAKLVCRRMDELARLVPFISERKVLETWDDPIGKCWSVLNDMVKKEQQTCNWPEKWVAFQTLGAKALVRVKERERQHAGSPQTRSA